MRPQPVYVTSPKARAAQVRKAREAARREEMRRLATQAMAWSLGIGALATLLSLTSLFSPG